jgi:hypothetical protein
MAEFDLDNIPKNLMDSINSGKCGLFVGAGLSINAGFPTWKQLLLELIEKVKNETRTPSTKIDELIYLVDNPSKYLLVAEELRDLLHTELPKYIKVRFDDKKIGPTSLHEKLFSIRHNYIITTNYDLLLENAYVKANGRMPNVYTYKDASSINYNLYERERFILKAHGDSSRAPEEIILTEKDYRRIIYNERGYQSILQAMFSTSNILFLGVSLNDPEINLLLGFIHHIFHGGSPDHYAIMAQDQVTETEIDRWRKDFKINIITYDPSEDHKQVEEFVDGLITKQLS